MNAFVSWVIAGVAVAAGLAMDGWPGVALAATLIVFWLLLQFSRALRALRKAGAALVRHVASAVMLYRRLRRGLTLVAVLALTGRLGERVEPPTEGAEESWRWRNDGGVSVIVHLRGGRCRGWALGRPEAHAQANRGTPT